MDWIRTQKGPQDLLKGGNRGGRPVQILSLGELLQRMGWKRLGAVAWGCGRALTFGFYQVRRLRASESLMGKVGSEEEKILNAKESEGKTCRRYGNKRGEHGGSRRDIGVR